MEGKSKPLLDDQPQDHSGPCYTQPLVQHPLLWPRKLPAHKYYSDLHKSSAKPETAS